METILKSVLESSQAKVLISAAEKECSLSFDLHSLFRIAQCKSSANGGLCIDASSKLSILLCANRLQDEEEVKSTVCHELIHLIDKCRGLDFSDLKAHACSEVRAASLSGDCSLSQEWQRGNVSISSPMKFFNFHEKCVKRRASLSLAMNPKCINSESARGIVEEVFSKCMDERYPYND